MLLIKFCFFVMLLLLALFVVSQLLSLLLLLLLFCIHWWFECRYTVVLHTVVHFIFFPVRLPFNKSGSANDFNEKSLHSKQQNVHNGGNIYFLKWMISLTHSRAHAHFFHYIFNGDIHHTGIRRWCSPYSCRSLCFSLSIYIFFDSNLHNAMHMKQAFII